MGVIYCMAHGKKGGIPQNFIRVLFVFFACLCISGLHRRRRQAICFSMARALVDGGLGLGRTSQVSRTALSSLQ
jgi:hypothetical protein